MNRLIDTVLFDIGNVLVGFDHYVISKSLSDYCHGFGPDEIHKLVFKKGMVSDYDKGNISSKGFYGLLTDKIGFYADFSTFSDKWCDGFYENKSIFNAVKAISADYNTGILSDTNHIHFSFMIKNYMILKLFKKFFLSYKLRSLKSEKEIYPRILNILKLRPEKILYIDDKPELTEIAKKIGYNTIEYTNIDRFKKDLIDYGICLNE